MANPMKLILGSLIGAGIGIALSKAVERRQEPGLSAAAALSGELPEQPDTGIEIKERLARARVAGQEARAAKEAELRTMFRARVQRPNALAEVEPGS